MAELDHIISTVTSQQVRNSFDVVIDNTGKRLAWINHQL
ncbi:hypothetical protein NC800_10855 [Aquibacillus sp. 3ASR75-286]|nr:hypothetical protein [Terrihalobacillus insolitus]MDC3413892.1 hypothetical protein [Terrihalobacillus insolitus]